MHRLKLPAIATLTAIFALTSIGLGEAEARTRRDRNSAAATAAAVGTIAAIAAAKSRRNRQYDSGYRYRGYRSNGYGYRNDGYGYRSPRYTRQRYPAPDGSGRGNPTLQFNVPQDGR